MTALQRDAYRTLLDYAWIDDGLTQDRIDQLISVLDLDPASCTSVVASCFYLDSTSERYRNERQEQERMGKRAYRALQRQLALDRAKAEKDELAPARPSEPQLAPLSTLLISSPLISKKKKKAPAEPWINVLDRPEYQKLRDSKPFALAWARWIQHCSESGTKAKEPSGSRAAAMLNEAVRDPGRYVLAIEQAIKGDYQGPNTDWVKASGSANGHDAAANNGWADQMRRVAKESPDPASRQHAEGWLLERGLQ